MAAKPAPAKEKPPAPKWRRRSDARPEEILEAALAEFTERGFDAARMEDVAKRAGLSKAGVYLYFESKEALLKALIEARISPFADRARAVARAGGEDPVTALRMIAQVAAHTLYDPKNVAVPRLIMSIAPRFPDIAIFHRTHVVEKVLGALEQLFAAGMEKGVFRKLEPRAAARAFIGPLLFEALWAHVLQGESRFAHPESLIDAHVDVLLHGLAKEPA